MEERIKELEVKLGARHLQICNLQDDVACLRSEIQNMQRWAAENDTAMRNKMANADATWVKETARLDRRIDRLTNAREWAADDRPLRHGRSWDYREDQALRIHFDALVKYVANRHGRSELAIKCRIRDKLLRDL